MCQKFPPKFHLIFRADRVPIMSGPVLHRPVKFLPAHVPEVPEVPLVPEVPDVPDDPDHPK